MKKAQGKEWAEKWAWEASEDDTAQIRMSVAAKRVRAEHARAVRIVKRIGKQDVLKRFNHKMYEYAEGYLKACLDILTALQRGRGGKG